MEMCASTKGEFEYSEDNSSLHNNSSLQIPLELDTTCLTSAEKKGEMDIFQDDILDLKYKSPGQLKNIKENSLPGVLIENTQGAELDMTCVATIEKKAGIVDDIYHKNILSSRYSSPKCENTEDNDLPGTLLENTQCAKLEMTCVATIEKEGGSVETDYIDHENSFPGVLQGKAADLDMTYMATVGRKGDADVYHENLISMRSNSPNKYVGSNEENVLPGTLLRNTLCNELDMTCGATVEKVGGKADDIFDENILNMARSSSRKHPVKAQLVNYVGPKTLGLNREVDTAKDLILSVNANISVPSAYSSSEHEEDIYSQKTAEQSRAYSTNAMEFTCAVNASIDESYAEDAPEFFKNSCFTSNKARKHTRFGSSIMDMSKSKNANVEKETSLSYEDISLRDTRSKEFMHEKLDVLNASHIGESLPQIVKPADIKVNYIFHDEDDGKMTSESQYLRRDCPYSKEDPEDLVRHEDSELMQLTCASMGKRSVAAHPELEIGMAENNEGGDNLSELRQPNQNKMGSCVFGDGKGKNLKRSYNYNTDANSSVVKRTKSLTPAIVYRMRKTKVTTEDVQQEIYLTPELKKVMNQGNDFGQDASIFSVGNLKRQKSSSVVEQSILTTKITNESELFSSSILQSNEEAVLNISSKTKIDSDQSISSSKLLSSTLKSVSSEVFCTNKINDSELFSSKMLQSQTKPIHHISCNPNMEPDQRSSSKLVTKSGIPKLEIFSGNSLTASESLSDHRVEKSFKASSPSKEESKSGSAWLKNRFGSQDQDNSKPSTATTPKAVTSEIFSSDVLFNSEIQKPNLLRETKMENSVKQSLKVSKKESRCKDSLIENAHNSHNPKFVSVIPEVESSILGCSILSTSEIQKKETKDSFVASSLTKEESMSESSQLKNVGKSNGQSEGASLVSDKISVSRAFGCRDLSLRDGEKSGSSFLEVIKSVPRRESKKSEESKSRFQGRERMTHKLNDSVKKQTSAKKFSFRKEKFNSESASISEETILDDEDVNVSTCLRESSANPQSKNSFRGEFKSSLPKEDLVSSSSTSMFSGKIPKIKIDDSALQTSKALQNLSRNVSSSIKFSTSFNQTGIPRESTMNESCSLQLLPESLLNDSISLCGSGVTKEKYDLQASTLFGCGFTEKGTKEAEKVAEGREFSISTREESGIEVSNSGGQGDVFPERSDLKSPDRDNPSPRAEADSFSKPSDSSVEIYRETEQNDANKKNENTSENLIESEVLCPPSPVKESIKAVEKEPNFDSSFIPMCNKEDEEMAPVNINLADVTSSNSSIEPAENRLSVLKKKIEEASGSKKRWFLVSLRENRAVFQLNWQSYLFWCRLKIHMNQLSSTESKISFSYKSRGEEIEDFGYKCFLHFMPAGSVPFPVCSEEIITKIEEYDEMARKVEPIMNDVMHLILFFKTTVLEGFNPIRIKTEVLNDHLISKFSLTYEVDFNTYPQKIVPKVEHLRLRNYVEKVQEAVATVEPGPTYLWKMAKTAQQISS